MNRTDVARWLRHKAPGFVIEVVVNFVAPVLIFDGLHAAWGDVDALLASSAPPLVWSIGGFLRDRRIDALSLLVLAGIVLSLLAFFGGGSARWLALREKMVTLLIAFAFLGSAAIGKPLIYPLARATMARESAENLARFEARRDNPLLRRTIMVMTLGWGFGLLADFLLSLVLLASLPMTRYIMVSPIVGYVTIGSLTLWTILYRRHRTRLAQAREATTREPNPEP